MPSKAAERINFGKIKEVITPPNLIEVQNNSYAEFLQSDIDPKKRKNLGLQAVFSEVFPIESYDGKCVLDFSHYEIGEPKLDWLECLREGITYGAPLHVSFRLKDEQGTKEEKVFMGELPLITPQGSFVINGAERVIVSQLHRSPGLAFEASQHPNGKTMHSFRIIPDRGSWYEAQFDTNDLLFVYLDRKKRRRKFLTTTFFRALGYGSDADILRLFYDIDEISVKAAKGMDDIQNKVLIEDILDLDKGAVVARAFEPMSAAVVREIANMGLKKIKVVDTSVDDGIIIKCLKKDPTTNEEEALKDIYRRLRPGDPPTAANARALLKRLFFDAKRYDLGRVGRYKISQKLNLDSNNESRVLEKEDLVAATKYLLKLKKGEGTLDDIDHLGSRRVRTVGELLANQCRVGLARTERLVKERMTLFDQGLDTMTPQKLINPKALSAVIRDFFGRSQLSQFMDQINPLAELTHKRRLSALGPGGLSRDRAGFEVRDVHPSHYGRICPIETPEGPNIGLIASLATFAKVNDFGFIETPYRKVVNGRVTSQLDYLTADREEQFIVAQANAPIDEKGKFQNERVMCRCKGDFIDVPPDRVDYMDVSPKQLVSVAAGLIPFLEHDDANRALMGSNMQRQAVPLLVSESPLVATGMESKVARDSCAVVSAEAPGVVASVSGNQVIITADGKLPEGKKRIKHDPANDIYVYRLRKFMRSNAATCINQKVLVQNGQKIKAGDLIADGPSTEDGELALGKNVLCAFMPWNGYNFEDAILISQRIVKDDVYTSIHIDEYEVSARDTKLGPEEITRDIPNLGEDALKNLGLDGVIRVGAEVKPGDILVGKITPKSETELAPEERLLRAIFGEKAADVKDTSLKVPSGTYGIVMDVKVSAKKESERTIKVSTTESKKHSKQVEDEHKKKIDDLREQLTESLSNILLGEKIPLDVVNSETGEIIIPANRKITKTLLRKLASVYDRIEIDPSPIRNKINEIISAYKKRFDDLQMQHDEEMERVESGDDMETGIIKSVKVFIASKRKLSVGDKMAGRHGNKGVVAKIVPEEDMPFLANGTPVDIVLNPLGVPSRMNVGQLLETHLGWAAKVLGMKFATPVFDGIKESEVRGYLKEAGLPDHAKIHLYDGRTGERFDQEIVVGFIYMLKLGHLVADKIHARAVGPYSLVTQQPLGGKAQYGGQRFGEMEVWAMEAYGAAYALQELLTVKSDDVQGRTRIYESIVKGDNSLDAGIPESFNVLVKEIQSLGMDVNVGYEPEEVDPDAELRSVPSSLSAMG
ncbi:MAG: DNA-directed RNA polymerase subunit beta [Verrucomicrobia bacterium]|jgi:DNA-directed RNA polymerase subunit beta|nr:DNA-directed RNA polymerase subunit beta [Verrucomicrobiota bacterium]MBT4275615.1 DNA-directed RNA polymerase subunit beta [Verrucomicrobiota bacterium]MBT5479555.1 DNA-directed RNA polymerase subunit beta [Verrucomicrobiota bacterium]MBT6238771.1 DNA-directed RNA polymerase subunit beta [Verrucomicrobiota bacterium]MBT7535966.1 DNA-directed RNA polymerase subunit beta [Verrucomicrobiota bacterium]